LNRWVLLVSFRPPAEPNEVQSWLARADAAPSGSPEVIDSSAGENLPGSVGGGDAVWDLRTQNSIESIPLIQELLNATYVASAEALALDTIASGYRALPGARIKRTLALTVREGISEPQILRFERSLQAMPDHIPEIGSWSLSRVRPETSNARWTHVWEQEYADVAGLRVAYMRSPYHWTGVDRWFDPEVPCSIVEPRLAHMFRWADRPVLGPLNPG
jgi:Stress responsive A/B Barrel Domain